MPLWTWWKIWLNQSNLIIDGKKYKTQKMTYCCATWYCCHLSEKILKALNHWILQRGLEDSWLNRSKHTEPHVCAVGEPHQNWIRKCNQGGLIMGGGLFSSASSVPTCAQTLATSCTGKERVSYQQTGESKAGEWEWWWLLPSGEKVLRLLHTTGFSTLYQFF